MSMKATYRQLGKSGLRISNPVLGGMSFGSSKWLNWIVDEEQGLAILKKAWDLGINTVDTANAYSNGQSETVIANFISKYDIPRERMVIATKVHAVVHEDPSVLAFLDPSIAQTKEYVNQGGLSRTALVNQVDASLRRLNTSYIDLLQIHAADPATPIEETMKALHDLVVTGKLRYIGACNLRVWQLAEMNSVAERHGWTPFISIQVEHSLLYRSEVRVWPSILLKFPDARCRRKKCSSTAHTKG
ncbi:hypothetical protein HGRIS_010266 [Hohenbuehelia grisea]|uniref:NADP-dependent oxidoreductase domain-containing protein n=1 Tax=Hohenbuehelia grisea TaxID=104357 RepID=A0ABR3J3S6_9AGAR